MWKVEEERKRKEKRDRNRKKKRKKMKKIGKGRAGFGVDFIDKESRLQLRKRSNLANDGLSVRALEIYYCRIETVSKTLVLESGEGRGTKG